jgi:endothelin-converting enzyme/putative endopeptidase
MERLPALVIKSPEEGGTYFENTKQRNGVCLRRFSRLENLDKTKWNMSPQTVNALLQPVLQ